MAIASDNALKEKISAILSSITRKIKTPIPKEIKPMLATLVTKPKEEEGWLYEVKWDGFRTLSYIHKGKVSLCSRNNKSFNDKFYPVYNQLKEWKINAIFDGEIIVMNSQGFPDFSALQAWRSEADGELIYYVFDILWLEGYDLMKVPLKERKNIISALLDNTGIIRASESFTISGNKFFELAQQLNLEGIIAKNENSVYQEGIRSKEWLKIKTEKHQEAIIAGYTRNENSNKLFSSLLLGIYENGELIPITPVGTGFSHKTQIEILNKLTPIKTTQCPFRETPDFTKPSRFRPNPPKAEITWVKPEIVAEITYQTVASDGSFRHPSFRGLREDKSANEVIKETPIDEIYVNENNLIRDKLIHYTGQQERKTLLNPSDETQVRNIEGHQLRFTNLSKIFWPREHISKRDMINYYYQVIPYMLPYMKDRPQTLNRFPNGIHNDSFYQKDVTGKVPGWIKKHRYYSETDQREKNFLVVTDEASLLYIANLGCIEMNGWSSKTQTPDYPDWCIIDLDPDGNPFEEVIETAQITRQVLDAIDIPSYCKTSGSTGMHIYIPLGAKYTYEESKEFARAVVKVIHKLIPDFTSIERYTSKRKGKLYLDFLQNRPQATVASVYSIRPKPGAPVSMPLHWDEVKRGITNQSFTVHNAIDRLKETGDLFQGVLGEGINMEDALQKLSKLFKEVKVKQR